MTEGAILLVALGALGIGQWITWQTLPPRRKARRKAGSISHAVAQGWGTQEELEAAQAWWRERCARLAAEEDATARQNSNSSTMWV